MSTPPPHTHTTFSLCLSQEEDFNELGMAAVHVQQALLEFGFQSTYAKLCDLCGPNGRLLDGRSDLDGPGLVFDPPEARWG